MSSKRSITAARWGRYLLAGALLAVLVASGISAQLFATSDAPQGSPIEDAHPTLYAHGDQLRPLVEATAGAQTLNIYGPGGQIIAQVAQDGSGGQEAHYLLADHLGSTRAILDADDNVVAHFEYGPHGETAVAAGAAAAQARYRYTGHPWDEAQGLYQTPARGYDPTTGRFLSVDPARQSTSPYSYTGNNPVTKVDPDGSAPLYFYLYSGYGVTVKDAKGMFKMRKSVDQMLSAARASGIPDIVTGQLDTTRHSQVSGPMPFDQGHMTLDMHGAAGFVSVLDPETQTRVRKNPEELATFLYERLKANVGEGSDSFRSVLLTACESACITEPSLGAGAQSRTSFADSFAGAASHLFPNLEHIFASPYAISLGWASDYPTSVVIDVFTSDEDSPDSLRIVVDEWSFFKGVLPPRLLNPPSAGSVHSVWTYGMQSDATFRYGRAVDNTTITSFLEKHRFTEPIFRKILVPQAVESPMLPTAD